MNRPSNSLLACAALAIIVGLVEPSVEVAWKCRSGHEASEACVWGRSYLPLSRALGLLVIAPVTFAVLLMVRRLWRSATGRTGSAD